MNCDGSWVEVDVSRLHHNVKAIKASLGETGLIAVIKSDAYGHGMEAVAACLGKSGVTRFAVAYAAEASVVRAAVPDAELILVLGVVREGDVPRLLQDRITPVLVSAEQGTLLSHAAVQAGGCLAVHLKLDTGMGRLGFICPKQVPDAVAMLSLPGLDVQGICTHFSMVEPERKPEPALEQIRRFNDAISLIEAAAGRRLFRHMSSSRAALLLPSCDHDAVRIGISLFGYGASEPGKRFATVPALQWKSRIMQVKTVPAGFAVGYYQSYHTAEETDVAVVSCGYTDGYQRLMGNKGHVLVGGERRPVVGRVSMNWISIDLGVHSGVKAGDEVVLIGAQGGEEIWANELAVHCKTISYEILTGISRQIERRYVGQIP